MAANKTATVKVAKKQTIGQQASGFRNLVKKVAGKGAKMNAGKVNMTLGKSSKKKQLARLRAGIKQTGKKK
jgi:hypothetical protein